MPITYTLKVTELDIVPQAEGQPNVVVNIHWSYTGTDGTRSAAFGGNTPVSYKQGDAFTAFADLTEEQVAGWVLGAWPEEQVLAQQNAIAAQLGVFTPPLPWAPTIEENDVA